jgi:hypothetical protein
MEVPASNLCPEIGYPEVFMVFLDPATNISIASQVKPLPLPSTPLPINFVLND